jgi:hypothetical protein
MILDEYGAEVRSSFLGSIMWVGMVLRTASQYQLREFGVLLVGMIVPCLGRLEATFLKSSH